MFALLIRDITFDIAYVPSSVDDPPFRPQNRLLDRPEEIDTQLDVCEATALLPVSDNAGRAGPSPEVEDGPARVATSRRRSQALPCRNHLDAFGGLFDQRRHRLGLRHVNGVAARNFRNG